MGDCVWKWNDDLIAYVLPEQSTDKMRTRYNRWLALPESQRADIRAKMKKSGADLIRQSPINEQVTLGVVVPNKLHPGSGKSEIAAGGGDCSIM